MPLRFCDNTLMKAVTMSSELAALAWHHALTIDEAERHALNALAAGFGPAEQRVALATQSSDQRGIAYEASSAVGNAPAERLTMFGWKDMRADG